jgi:dolichyl-phosphate-mannose-protein mannosyltransferase
MSTKSAIACGVIAGVAYSISPLAVLFALALVPLFRWAASGIGGAERQWLLSVLIAAAIVRIAAVAALLLLTNPALEQFRVYVPDARFAIARSWWIRNQWLGIDVGPVYRLGIYNPYGATSYAYVLAAIQLLVGESPYGVNFIAALAFLAAAVALYRVARESYGPLPALIGLTTLVFWPSMTVWSVSALRESFQLALTAAVIVGVVHAVRGGSWLHRIAATVVVVAALAMLSTIRAGALLIVGMGVAIALAGRVATLRPAIARLSIAALIAACAWAMAQPALQQRFLVLAQQAIMRHVGEVATTGNSYKLLEYRFYADTLRDVIGTLTFGEAVDFFIRSAAAFFIEPLPWQLSSRTELLFFPQQVCWLALSACAIAGIVAGYRSDPLLTWLLVGYIAASVAVIAPNSANIGTLVRHRDVIMPALAWLGAAGLCGTVAWHARRSGKAFA